MVELSNWQTGNRERTCAGEGVAASNVSRQDARLPQHRTHARVRAGPAVQFSAVHFAPCWFLPRLACNACLQCKMHQPLSASSAPPRLQHNLSPILQKGFACVVQGRRMLRLRCSKERGEGAVQGRWVVRTEGSHHTLAQVTASVWGARCNVQVPRTTPSAPTGFCSAFSQLA